jgi:Predicted HD-superfamily hydrolase
MKEFYICDCVRQENKIVTSTFVVVAKQIKPKKTGEPYLALTLGDRSGQLEAKMWDNVEEVLEAFRAGRLPQNQGVSSTSTNNVFSSPFTSCVSWANPKLILPITFLRPPRTLTNSGGH